MLTDVETPAANNPLRRGARLSPGTEHKETGRNPWQWACYNM